MYFYNLRVHYAMYMLLQFKLSGAFHSLFKRFQKGTVYSYS